LIADYWVERQPVEMAVVVPDLEHISRSNLRVPALVSPASSATRVWRNPTNAGLLAYPGSAHVTMENRTAQTLD